LSAAAVGASRETPSRDKSTRDKSMRDTSMQDTSGLSKMVIGIHDGHNASVAVVRDGRLEYALQEERITRIKNQGDAPGKALDRALAGHAAGSARIALNGRYMNYGQWQRETILGDYRRASTFASRIRQPLKDTFLDRAYQRRKAASREDRLSALGLSRERIEPVEHHLAHASAAYYTCPWPDERVLVLTCDGSGDRLSATVSLGERGDLQRIAQVSEHDSIGRLYAMVTRHLGMAPLEHEYKVMGLAPYVSDGTKTAAAADWFRQLFEFTREPMIWRRRRGVPSMYAAGAFLDRLLAGQRFDLIAAGVQRFIEDWITDWARNCIRETGIRKVACSGGVFMNVKANLRLLEIPELEDLYIFPSCGDESNSIGAALRLAAEMGQRHRGSLGPIYYGEPITDGEAAEALDAAGRGANRARFRAAYESDIERKTAEGLAAGKIIARAKGAMEFGARALGNRSILARADSVGTVQTLNRIVKSRDFWMPFAPSVLAERAGEYFYKPKPVASPYMMFAFPSRPEKRAAFVGAQHPYDFTARPHEVAATHNPDYYRLLQEYEARTGEAIVLNTSFNLHGEPMVFRARDAVDVFLRSGLECMALGNWWVEKADKTT
jgi:carbamoyltransferase